MARPKQKLNPAKGSLVIVGTGILAAAQCSIEARAHMQDADVVFVAIPDALALNWVYSLNANVVGLDDLYFACPDRLATYYAMVDRILSAVRAGARVCAVFYGHPGVFVLPSHLAIEMARNEGYDAQMLPGISAADCLYADLGVDPSHPGCQMYEASAFLFWRYNIAPQAALILWQIGVVGDHTFTLRAPALHGLGVLTSQLLEYYPADHLVCVYEATQSPLQAPRMDWIALSALPKTPVNGYSTLYIPPFGKARANRAVLRQLGIAPADVGEPG